jgi:hypothetical protein
MKGPVEAPDFRYQVNLAGVAVVALDAEHEAVHHFPQAATGGQFVRPVEAPEMAEVPALNFRAAELI